VREAKAEWLCWLSGDDYFHPQKLEANRGWIRDYPKIHFFFTGFWLIEPDGKKREYPLDWLKLENPAYHLIQLLRNNWVMGISICIKREAWLRTGEFDGRYRYAHDLDMWVRLMLTTPNRYLPERTCTMRYHPGQETARFPLAPVFDAAKILIRLVNEHSFKELFPFENLEDGKTARDVLSRTVNFVVSSPDANVYRLGYHPLVHFRMLEWIWDPSMESKLREDLRRIIVKQAPGFMSYYNHSPFGLLWKAVFAALMIDQPRFTYFPCEADKVGEINYYIQRAGHSEVAQPLRDYLEQNDGVSFEEAPMDVEKAGELVLLLPPDLSLDDPSNPEFMRLKEIWQYLTRVGFFVLLVGKSKYTMGLMDGLPYLGYENGREQNKLLTALGILDTVVALSHPERLKWVRAERPVAFEVSSPALSGIELFMALIQMIQSAPRQEFKTTFNNRILRYIHNIYRFLVPNAVREKIQLRQRLRFIWANNQDYLALILKKLPFEQQIAHFARRIYRIFIPNSIREKGILAHRLRSIADFLIGKTK
jgi:hypothetical protein